MTQLLLDVTVWTDRFLPGGPFWGNLPAGGLPLFLFLEVDYG